MNTSKKFNLAVVAVTLAMAVILPLLAYLQYTWLGELSKQEYKRMQDNLRTAAFHCSMEFSMEMTAVLQGLGGPLTGDDEEMKRIVLARIDQWIPRATHRELVLHQVSIGRLPAPDAYVEIKADEQTSLYVMKDLSAVGIQIAGRPGEAVFVPLDTKYITTTYLSGIITKQFSSESISVYDIVVTDNAGAPLWNTAGADPAQVLAVADVVESLVRFPPMPLSSMPKSGPGIDRRGPVEKNGPGDRTMEPPGGAGSMPPDMRYADKHERGPDNRGGGFGDKRGPNDMNRAEGGRDPHSLLRIYIRHHDGSLEAAVNRNRLRSLAISFSVLLLLGSSVIFLLLSAGRAQRLAQQQMEFVAGVSHELRTPLAVLKAAGENLADGVIHEKERAQQYGDLIKKEVTRLSEMVEKALAFAGIQSGKVNYEVQPVDIAMVIDEAVEKTERMIISDDAIFNVNIEPDLPEVLGNADALRSAIENLTMNAVKYSGEKIWIGIEVRRARASRGAYIAIMVTDHGIGIPPEDVKHVFKPFYRSRSAIDGQIQGNGLGLSIAKHIIEAHHGRITVVSTLRWGSTFTILLPIPKQDGEHA